MGTMHAIGQLNEVRNPLMGIHTMLRLAEEQRRDCELEIITKDIRWSRFVALVRTLERGGDTDVAPIDAESTYWVYDSLRTLMTYTRSYGEFAVAIGADCGCGHAE